MKILILDVEWRPTKAWVWQPWKENILPEKIIEHGGLLCVGVKWLGEKTCYLYSEWEHGHKGMLEAVHEMMSEADAIVTYNGDKYDLPKLQGEFLLNGFPPPPPPTSIDVLKAVKKFGLFMNRLAFVGPFLGVGGKLAHEGMSLWTKVIAGDTKAQARMAKYCVQDVVLLEKLYKKVKPYIRNHPQLKAGCPNCGSDKLQSRGYTRSRLFKTQRIHCQSCGAWSTGTRTKI